MGEGGRGAVPSRYERSVSPDFFRGLRSRPSRDGTYLSLTCTFSAQSKQQLDDLYRELTSCERVMVVL